MKFIAYFFFSLISSFTLAQTLVTSPIRTYEGHANAVKSIAFSADGKKFVSGGIDKTMKYWNLYQSKPVASIETQDEIRSISISPLAKYALTAYTPTLSGTTPSPKVALAWNIAKQEKEQEYALPNTSMQSLIYSPNGKMVAGIGYDGTVKVWSAENGKEIFTIKTNISPLTCVAFAPDNNHLGVGGKGKHVIVWDLSMKPVGEVADIKTNFDEIAAIAFSPDGKTLGVAGNENEIGTWNYKEDKRNKIDAEGYTPWKGHTQKVFKLNFNKDGKYIVTGGADGIVRVWETTLGKEMMTLKGHTGFVHDVLFSADNRYVLSAGGDRMIKLWDITTLTNVEREKPMVMLHTPAKNTNASDSLFQNFRFGLVSVYPLKSIKMLQNQVAVGEPTLAETEDEESIYRLKKIPLAVGENKFVIEMQTEIGKVQSEPIRINYTPQRPKIALVSAPIKETADAKTELEFCVQSDVPLTAVKFYSNGSAIPDDKVQRTPNANGCTEKVIVSFPLIYGNNNYYLLASNNGGTSTGEDKTIYRTPPKPEVRWITPLANEEVGKDTFGLEFCVKTAVPMTKYRIRINGKEYASRGFAIGKDDVLDPDCPTRVKSRIPLVQGKNHVKVLVITELDSVYSEERQITFIDVKDTNAVYGDYYALLIGENEYQNAGIPDLQKPITDAKTIAETLSKYYTFDKKNITLLENPTKSQILQELERFSKFLKEEDKLLIFYAGHGTEKDKIGYLLPSDADPKSKIDWLSAGQLKEYIATIPTKHTLLLLDACFSGSFVMRDAITEQLNCSAWEDRPSRMAITSGAQEEVPDQSVFVEYLVEYLKNTPKTCFTSRVLYGELTESVPHNSGGKLPQQGPLEGTGHKGGDFIFRKK